LSLSLTWGWLSVSRRQCHDLKNKTTVLVITCNQLIRLRLISATIYTNASNHPEELLQKGGCHRVPVVYPCKCTKRGAATAYLWCISVNGQGEGAATEYLCCGVSV
jgi:hypothetical protein